MRRIEIRGLVLAFERERDEQTIEEVEEEFTTAGYDVQTVSLAIDDHFIIEVLA